MLVISGHYYEKLKQVQLIGNIYIYYILTYHRCK